MSILISAHIAMEQEYAMIKKDVRDILDNILVQGESLRDELNMLEMNMGYLESAKGSVEVIMFYVSKLEEVLNGNN
jgi:hypothetical protein